MRKQSKMPLAQILIMRCWSDCMVPSNDRESRYSPATCIGGRVGILSGNPDLKHVSTSYVERQNLSMRMGMRRFTRLSNGFQQEV